jgi:DNA repair protein RadA/Sms
VRAISHVEMRISEIKKMGFTTCLIPAGNLKRMPEMEGIRLVGIRTVSDAVDELF